MNEQFRLIEQHFIAVIVEEIKALKMKHGDFAVQVWTDVSPDTAKGRWVAMRNIVSKTGKPQGVLISDALSMAKVLKSDLGYLLVKARLRYESKQEKLGETGKAK